MKKSDIAMIILIASVSVLIGFFVASSLPFLQVDQTDAMIPTVDKISSEVNEPDPTVFNKEAINPTIQSVIGGADND